MTAILSPTEFKKLVAQFAGHDLSRKSILSIRDGAGVIEGLLEGGKYRRVLEIGTYRGVSSAYISQFCDRVITIDLVKGKLERDNQVFNRGKFWRALNIHNIDLRLVRSNSEKAEVVSKEDFDFAFIDGDHSFEGVSVDFDLVKRCGAVLFHDYLPGNDVARFVDGLKPAARQIDMFAFWNAGA